MHRGYPFKLCFVMILFLLSGCSARKPIAFEKRPEIDEARVPYLSFPSGTKVHEVAAQQFVGGRQGGRLWKYNTKLSSDVLYAFYRKQAELNGWCELFGCITDVGDLYFAYERPGKLLVIDARKMEAGFEVRCFVGMGCRVPAE